MRDLPIIITMALLLLMLSSCGDKYEPSVFKKIDLEVSGIDLINSKRDSYLLEGTIPASGARFSVIPEEKFKEVAIISFVAVDKTVMETDEDLSGEPPYILHYPVLSGDWGEISYDYNFTPHVINFDLFENKTDVPRRFIFTIGYAYTYTSLEITQEAGEQQ